MLKEECYCKFRFVVSASHNIMAYNTKLFIACGGKLFAGAAPKWEKDEVQVDDVNVQQKSTTDVFLCRQLHLAAPHDLLSIIYQVLQNRILTHIHKESSCTRHRMLAHRAVNFKFQIIM
jgi:hypothetical protein